MPPITWRTATLPSGVSVNAVGMPASDSGLGAIEAAWPAGRIGPPLLDAEHAEMAPVPWLVEAPAIAEPQEGDRKVRRVLQAQHDVARIGPDRRRPAERRTRRLDQHDEILVPLGHRIAVQVDGRAVGQRQLAEVGEALGPSRTASGPWPGRSPAVVSGRSPNAFGEKDRRPSPAKWVMAWLDAETAPEPPVNTWRS